MQQDTGYFMAHIGVLDKQMELKVDYIKRCTLMTHIRTEFGALPLTREILLQAIQAMNEQSERFLLRFQETEKRTTTKPTMNCYDVVIYCEDPALSLHRHGQEIFVVCPEKSDNFVTLNPEQVNELLDMCMAFHEIDYKMGGPATKAMRDRAITSPAFVNMREMMGRLTVQAHRVVTGIRA